MYNNSCSMTFYDSKIFLLLKLLKLNCVTKSTFHHVNIPVTHTIPQPLL